MPLDRFALRAMSRRVVHGLLGVPITYYPRNTRQALGGLVNPLTARLHTRGTVDPDNTGQGGAQIVDTNTHVIFNTEQLAAVNLIPVAGDRVVFEDGSAYRLDIRTQTTGPIAQKWTVTPTGQP